MYIDLQVIVLGVIAIFTISGLILLGLAENGTLNDFSFSLDVNLQKRTFETRIKAGVTH